MVCLNSLLPRQYAHHVWYRNPFPKKSHWRASQKLQLIHADLCGPITPISNGSKRYLISFIDDFTRKVWIYFLVEKSDAFNTFKHFKSLVEKETESEGEKNIRRGG